MSKQFNSDKIKSIIQEKVKRKVTKKELAEVAGIAPSQLNYWSENQQSIIEFLTKISEHYKVSIDKLLNE